MTQPPLTKELLDHVAAVPSSMTDLPAPELASDEDLARLGALVDEIGQCKSKGEILALLVGYRHEVRRDMLRSLTVEDPTLAPSNEMRRTVNPRPLARPIDDYWRAPGGDGALAATWRDKPHRLLYDLVAALRHHTRDGTRHAPPLPPHELRGTWPPGVQRAFVEGASWWQSSKAGATPFGDECREMEAEAERRYGVPQQEIYPLAPPPTPAIVCHVNPLLTNVIGEAVEALRDDSLQRERALELAQTLEAAHGHAQRSSARVEHLRETVMQLGLLALKNGWSSDQSKGLVQFLKDKIPPRQTSQEQQT